MPAILWPDVEAATVAYLRPLIVASALPFAADVRVSDRLTDRDGDPRPDYAVIVRHDGGSPTDTVFTASRIGVNVWALTKPEAVDLAALVTALMNGAPGDSGGPIAGADANVAFTVPDASGQPHLYLTAIVQVRGTVL